MLPARWAPGLMDKFPDAYDVLDLTISQRKTQVMGQATPAPPCITNCGEELEVVHQFQYLRSTTTDTLSVDIELIKVHMQGIDNSLQTHQESMGK